MNVRLPGSTDEAFPGPEVCSFIEEEQTRAYRKLGERMGLGSDPQKIHAHFTRDIMPAAHASPEKFEAELKRQGISLSPQQSAENARQMKAAYERFFSQRVPTPYEDPNRYGSLAMTFDSLHRALATKPRLPQPHPFLATLPSGQVDARIARERVTRSPVIFFERGLFQYFHDFALLTGWAMPSISIEQMQSDAALSAVFPPNFVPPPAARFFASALLSYVVDGSPALKHEPISRPPHNAFLPVYLLAHMERFVMAHELAHLSLGHLNRSPSPNDEFDADVAGNEVVTRLSLREAGSWAMGYWGMDVAFVALNFLYRALGVLAFGPTKLKWINSTHPDPLARRARVATQLKNASAPAEGQAASRQLSQITEIVFQTLWKLSEPIFISAHLSGNRPSPLWTDLIGHCFAPREASST